MTTFSNLPSDIAAFVGRDAEQARACQLLRHVRLLTLTGPGGVGKTRLALRVADRLRMSGTEGAWVDLGELPRPKEVSPERLYTHMAIALGIRHHGQAGLDVLLDHLRSRRVLLVLDNCEHLVPATRACVTALLHAAPNLRVLATSRQALGADGEHTLVVPPLPLKDSIALFTTLASAAGAEVVVDPNVIAELCRRLDGLPLAIRLAAGRARTLSVQQLLHRLDDRFRVLTDTALVGADSPHRHSTMQRVVDWSYELCTDPERLLWARASVFTHAVDLSAVEAICGGDGLDPAGIVDLVAGLVAKSVLAVDHSTNPIRYHLLATLRDHGLRKLDIVGETQRVRARHRDYYRDLVAQAAATWFGPAELDAMAAVQRDLPGLLAAVDECLNQRDLPTAHAICRDLVRVRAPFFWGFLDLARQQLRRVIDASDADLVRTADEAADLSSTMAAAAWVAATQGQVETATTLLAAVHDLHLRWGVAATPPALFAEGGTEALGAGSHRAIGLLDAARAGFTEPRTTGDQHMATMMWAMATAFAGDPASAVTASEEYLRQAEQAKSPWAISWALWVAALGALRSGSHQQATDFVRRGLTLQRDMDDQWGQAWSIELCAWIIAARINEVDNPREAAERAAWLLGASRARQHRLGVTLAGLRPLAERHARCQERVTAVLDELTVAAAMAAGSRGHAQAVRVALGEPTPRRPSAAGADGLTNREREVATLVAEGQTSAQIAAQLRINPRTVDVHVRTIMQKLGVRKRAAIAAWAVAQPGHQSHPFTLADDN